MKKLSILGDFDPSKETHIVTNKAIEHSLQSLNNDLDINWIQTSDISENLLQISDGFLVAPGSPYQDM